MNANPFRVARRSQKALARLGHGVVFDVVHNDGNVTFEGLNARRLFFATGWHRAFDKALELASSK